MTKSCVSTNEYRIKTLSFVKNKETGTYEQVQENYNIKCNSFAEAFNSAINGGGIVELSIARIG